MNREAAENLAIQALTYLAAEPEKLDAFLASAGIDAGAIRAAAREPGFLAGVLDHLAANERLLIGFAEEVGCDPSLVMRARATLSGEPWERDVP
jgi:hypothetical protein